MVDNRFYYLVNSLIIKGSYFVNNYPVTLM